MTTNDKLADALDELCDAVRVYDRCPDKYNHNAMTEARAAVASLAAPPAQGEWPEHRACVPYKNGARLVGFVIEQGDEAYGDIGLTEPLCWLARMCKQQPAPAPVQVDVLGELADEIEAMYPNADASNLRAFAADAQPPAPAEVELPPLPELPPIRDRQSIENYATAYARAAVAALAQQPDTGRIDELESICGEAYQVVGSLLNDLGQFDSEHARKILDNLGEQRMVHKDVMATWPSFAQQPGAQAVAWHTDDHLTDKSATTYDPTVADRWRAKGWPVTAHYTAPPPLPLEPEPDLDERDPKSGELVAQWLFRNGFRELAAVVRAQLDMRAPRKAPPPLPEGVSEEDVEAGAEALWLASSHKLLEKSGYPVDWASQPSSVKRGYRKQARGVVESYRARLAAKGGV